MPAPRCQVCGRPIVAVHRVGPPITLARVWMHRSRLRNLLHWAIPPEGM